MKRFVAGITLATGLAIAGCEAPAHLSEPTLTPTASPTPTEDTPQVGVAYLTATDKNTITSIYGKGRAYIESRHPGSTAMLKLVILEGTAQSHCEQTLFTSTGPGPEYCNENASVLFDAQFADKDVPELLDKTTTPANKRPGLTVAALEYVTLHELGHHEQIIEDPTSYIQTHAQKEQQADCLAGEMLVTIDPAAINDALTFIKQIPGDPAHGTTADRVTAFTHGASVGGCVAP